MKKLSLLVLFAVLSCFVANAQYNSKEVFRAHYNKDMPIHVNNAKFTTPANCLGLRFTLEKKGKCDFQGTYVTPCGHFSYSFSSIELSNTSSSQVSKSEFWFGPAECGEAYNWDIDLNPVSDEGMPWGGSPNDLMIVKIEYFW